MHLKIFTCVHALLLCNCFQFANGRLQRVCAALPTCMNTLRLASTLGMSKPLSLCHKHNRADMLIFEGGMLVGSLWKPLHLVVFVRSFARARACVHACQKRKQKPVLNCCMLFQVTVNMYVCTCRSHYCRVREIIASRKSTCSTEYCDAAWKLTSNLFWVTSPPLSQWLLKISASMLLCRKEFFTCLENCNSGANPKFSH